MNEFLWRSSCHRCYFPLKINGWNLTITQLKRNIIFQTSIFLGSMLIFRCYYVVKEKMMEKGKSEMEEEKKSWPGSFNLANFWKVESGKWSTPWRSLGKFGNFRELFRIWDLNQVVILMSIGLVFMKRWTQSWVSPIDTTWGMQSMRSSRRLGWKKEVKDVSCFVSPCGEMILRYCMSFAHMWPLLSLWTVTGWS